jgi:hypothetical protein
VESCWEIGKGDPYRSFPVNLTRLRNFGVRVTMRIALLLVSAVMLVAQNRAPRFEDFPAPTDWKGPPTAVKLATRSERLFRTRLLQAANKPPNFATHYRFTMWGCGSECASGAIIDFATGQVIAPPLAERMSFSVCQSAYEGFGVEVRPESRLMVLRCGLNFDVRLQRNVPDVYYFVLEGEGFHQLAHFHGKWARLLLKDQ